MDDKELEYRKRWGDIFDMRASFLDILDRLHITASSSWAKYQGMEHREWIGVCDAYKAHSINKDVCTV